MRDDEQELRNLAFKLFDLVHHKKDLYFEYLRGKIDFINWDDELEFDDSVFEPIDKFSYFHGMSAMKNVILEIIDDIQECGLEGYQEFKPALISRD